MPQVRRAGREWLISETEAVRLVGLGLAVSGTETPLVPDCVFIDSSADQSAYFCGPAQGDTIRVIHRPGIKPSTLRKA